MFLPRSSEEVQMEPMPVTGEANPGLSSIDQCIAEVMQKWEIPGGQCGIAKDGRLVYARGFGTVDQVTADAPPPLTVSPTALFRIASSTKPITAVAVLRLVEQGRLQLDDRAFEILHDLTPPAGAAPDPRLRSITIRHLLEHSSGLHSAEAGDPQFATLRSAADAFHHPRPATNVDIIRYMMGQPLVSTPGTEHVYSNLGYNVLGRVIEHQTKLSYGDAVRQLVLQPAGVKRMALMTRTSPEARLPDEVFYVDGRDWPPCWPIYEGDPEMRPYSYGSFDGSAVDAHGGWIANAIDLTRFLNAVGGSNGTQLLAPSTVATMLARPDLPQYQGKDKDRFYALGWNVVPGRIEMSHSGSLADSTYSVIERLPGGVTCAMVFNHFPSLDMAVELGERTVAAIEAVKIWPEKDLYSSADR